MCVRKPVEKVSVLSKSTLSPFAEAWRAIAESHSSFFKAVSLEGLVFFLFRLCPVSLTFSCLLVCPIYLTELSLQLICKCSRFFCMVKLDL